MANFKDGNDFVFFVPCSLCARAFCTGELYPATLKGLLNNVWPNNLVPVGSEVLFNTHTKDTGELWRTNKKQTGKQVKKKKGTNND